MFTLVIICTIIGVATAIRFGGARDLEGRIVTGILGSSFGLSAAAFILLIWELL